MEREARVIKHGLAVIGKLERQYGVVIIGEMPLS